MDEHIKIPAAALQEVSGVLGSIECDHRDPLLLKSWALFLIHFLLASDSECFKRHLL